jgi:hypothetical protein
MTLDELTQVLAKISAIEGRTYTAEEAEVWHEILGGRNAADANAAVITFYSKPFTHRAYPGDINALVEDIEKERLQMVGDVRASDIDWGTADDIGTITRRLYQHIRKGRMTRARYDEYQQSGLTLEAFLAQEEEPANA